MRKFLTIIVYSFLLLMIGRNLTVLPKFSLFSNKESVLAARTDTLKEIIEKNFAQSPGDYSVYFVDFKTNQAVGVSEKQQFRAASVNKVPIVASLYYLAHKGKIDLDEKVTVQEVDIQNYGTGTIRYQKPGGIYSLKSLAKLALKQSDNTAAHILKNRIGADVLQQTISTLGLRQTDIENNKTSNHDMSLLFKSIYTNKITSEAKTQELLSFMKDIDIEDRLSKNLPSDVTFYHKTGDEEGNVHDVGILTDNNGTIFYVGVLTAEVSGKEAEVTQSMNNVGEELTSFLKKEKE